MLFKRKEMEKKKLFGRKKNQDVHPREREKKRYSVSTYLSNKQTNKQTNKHTHTHNE